MKTSIGEVQINPWGNTPNWLLWHCGKVYGNRMKLILKDLLSVFIFYHRPACFQHEGRSVAIRVICGELFFTRLPYGKVRGGH